MGKKATGGGLCVGGKGRGQTSGAVNRGGKFQGRGEF